MRKETRCRQMGYSFRLPAHSEQAVIAHACHGHTHFICILYNHRQDSTYFVYTNRGSLAGTRNKSMDPPRRIDPTTHRTMSDHSYHGATSRCPVLTKASHIVQKHIKPVGRRIVTAGLRNCDIESASQR